MNPRATCVSSCGAQNSFALRARIFDRCANLASLACPLAVPKIPSHFVLGLLTAAPTSPRFICRRQRSARLPVGFQVRYLHPLGYFSKKRADDIVISASPFVKRFLHKNLLLPPKRKRDPRASLPFRSIRLSPHEILMENAFIQRFQLIRIGHQDDRRDQDRSIQDKGNDPHDQTDDSHRLPDRGF